MHIKQLQSISCSPTRSFEHHSQHLMLSFNRKAYFVENLVSATSKISFLFFTKSGMALMKALGPSSIFQIAFLKPQFCALLCSLDFWKKKCPILLIPFLQANIIFGNILRGEAEAGVSESPREHRIQNWLQQDRTPRPKILAGKFNVGKTLAFFKMLRKSILRHCSFRLAEYLH